MLQSLHVHNFALIEDAKVDFSRGFNIFTGETGAGKSILIDAFGIALGNRASASFVRAGTDAFWVQAVFDMEDDPRIRALLKEQGIEEDDSLFLKRRVTASGKSQSSVNGIQVPLAVLKQFSVLLVDIHGQHENQALLRTQTPRILTDAFSGPSGKRLLEEYRTGYRSYLEAREELEALEAKGDQRERLMDRLEWEIQEISEAKIREGEEEGLREEAETLQHSGRIMKAVTDSHEYLDREEGALEILAHARDSLESALRYDAKLQPLYELLDSVWISADEARSQLRDYLESRDFDGERMTEVQERLDLLYRLQKKYGEGEDAVLRYLERAKEQYAELQELDERIADATRRLKKLEETLGETAGRLTASRKKAAEELCRKVEDHIHDLAMPAGRFTIAFTDSGRFTPDGCDTMQFLFSANAGEPLQPLAQVASGGELSRLALALKTVLMGTSGVNTMVFDEIDTGVGGVTAQKMAEKIAHIAGKSQVLCITHLPQIAAFADRHIRIVKDEEGGRTATRLMVLDEQGRVEELVRMTGGSHQSATAEANARELLAAAGAYGKE